MSKAACVGDYRALAKARLPHFLFQYIDGGSYGEVTLRRNVADLEAVALRQRVMRDVSAIDVSTELFGKRWAMPVGLGPVGLAGLNARRGEVQAARAAAAAGVPFALSTVSACSIGEVAAGTEQPASASLGTGFWFQLYMIRDRGFMRELMAHAREAKCGALLFTVDLPVPGSRYGDYRSGLAGAKGWRGSARRFGQVLMRPRWCWDVGLRGRPHNLGNVAPVLGAGSGLEDFLGWIGSNFDPSVTWKDLDWIRSEWNGPLVIKGILDPDDAREAVANGADAIVVSNHGGRQLDGVASTARALPAIADAVGGRVPLLADGGVRSGLDVVRMLALGADFVLLGRAWAYALAAGGQAGVTHMLQLVEAEIRVAMALTGCTTVAGIGPDTLDRHG
jgi:L-lactate dehydrogenase (cytochrome)